jgi:SPP1 family predicted phage head-tail adaptor
MARAGRLRSRCTFQRRAVQADAYGNRTGGTWEDLFTVWGGLDERGVREGMTAGRLQSEVSSVLSVRSSSDTRGVVASDRVLIDGAGYVVTGITNPDQRNAMLEMFVTRGGPQS